MREMSGQVRILQHSEADQELAGRSGDATSAEELNNLARQLNEGDSTARVEAARHLQRYGSEAVPALCEALEHGDPELRLAVVESLGAVGDTRAVRPLLEALHRCHRKVGADQRRMVFFLALAALGGMGAAYWIGIGSFAASPLLVALAGCGSSLDGYRRRSSPLNCRIAEALARIAERYPNAALREVIRELEEVGSSFVLQDSSARDAILGTAQRIDALTHTVKDLPRAAERGGVAAANLPRVEADGASGHRDWPVPLGADAEFSECADTHAPDPA